MPHSPRYTSGRRPSIERQTDGETEFTAPARDTSPPTSRGPVSVSSPSGLALTVRAIARP
jgi:hypothetical protein